MDAIFKTEGLVKNYGSKKVLRGIDIELGKGRIMGLLGPNGSGKTTLMKIAAGLIRPTSGRILIDDHEPGIYTKSIVSYLPDVNFLPKWMKIKDAIVFFKDFYVDFDPAKAEELLQFMKLDASERVVSLSKGMTEKLLLTLALARKARLYIFDEPLGGVDPVAREKIIDAILNNYREDSSVIISTHLVKDIERLFDEVYFLSDGTIALNGNAEELRLEKGMSMDELYREVFA